jgi:hypothetical protein
MSAFEHSASPLPAKGRQFGKSAEEKITRDAFLYMAPVPPEQKFAQCEECRVFVPREKLGSEAGRCVFHGAQLPISYDQSCGLFCPWPKGKKDSEVIAEHVKAIQAGIAASVTPEESGLVSRQVRCENCEYFEKQKSLCGLYLLLNKMLPQIFNLDTRVEPYACCNAQTP